MLVVITSGTIDKTYIPRLIPDTTSDSYVELTLKDSLKMTDSDREEIFSICLRTKENKILITHGTDTMVKSVIHLGLKQHKLREKVIVFVGGMPWWLPNSNASFNIGFAIASLQLLTSGIFIAMDAQIFNWHNVRNNMELNQFEKPYKRLR